MDRSIIEEIIANGFDFEEELENHNLEIIDDEITGYDEDIKEFLTEMVQEVGEQLVKQLVSGQTEIEPILDEIISEETEMQNDTTSYVKTLKEIEKEYARIDFDEVEKVGKNISQKEIEKTFAESTRESASKSLIEELLSNGYDVQNLTITDEGKLVDFLRKQMDLTSKEGFDKYKEYLRDQLGRNAARPLIDLMYVIQPYPDPYFMKNFKGNGEFGVKVFLYNQDYSSFTDLRAIISPDRFNFEYIYNSPELSDDKKFEILNGYIMTNYSSIKSSDDVYAIEDFLNNKLNAVKNVDVSEYSKINKLIAQFVNSFSKVYIKDERRTLTLLRYSNNPESLAGLPFIKRFDFKQLYNSNEFSDEEKLNLISKLITIQLEKRDTADLTSTKQNVRSDAKRLEKVIDDTEDYLYGLMEKESDHNSQIYKKSYQTLEHIYDLCFDRCVKKINEEFLKKFDEDFFDYLLEDCKNSYHGKNLEMNIENEDFIFETLIKGKLSNNEILDGLHYTMAKEIATKGHSAMDCLNEISDIDKFLDEYIIDIDQLLKRYNQYKRVEFDFSDLTPEEQLQHAVESNIAVFLHGRPGHGKSSRVYQLDPDLTEVNLSLMDLDILDGIAGIDEKTGEAIHNKPEWLKELEEKCEADPDHLHILFLEELSNASPRMQAKAYGIALDKKVAGKWDLPKNARVVAAGNDVNDSYIVNEIPEPLYARFAHIRIHTNAEDFLRWGITPQNDTPQLEQQDLDDDERKKIHPYIYSFIATYGDSVLREQYDRDNPQPFADPRRWKMASDMLYASNNPTALKPIIGEKLTEEFVKFCQLRTLPTKDILQGNYTKQDLNIGKTFKYATIAKLVTVSEKQMPMALKFARDLGPEFANAFELQWAYNNPERQRLLKEEYGVTNEKWEKGEDETERITYGLVFSDMSEMEQMLAAINSNISLYLHGKPGSGKSARVKQLDEDFVELNLNHMDPEILDGIAGIKGKETIRLKPEWLKVLEEKCEKEPDSIHILFLDELSNASPMMQAKAYGIVLEKKVAGKWRLPANVRIVAAGNETDDSYVANDMPEALYKRFAHITIETTAENWLDWAVTPDKAHEIETVKTADVKELQNKPLHPAIYAYISTFGDEVLETPFDIEHPSPHADPRRWKMASDVLYITQNPMALEPIIGTELTLDFLDFCSKSKITLEDVLSDREFTPKELKMDMATKLATITGLLAVDEKNMPKVREFVKKLGPEMRKKFEVQWAFGNKERMELLQEIAMEEAMGENSKHDSSEAKGTSSAGVVAFKTIDKAYNDYLSEKTNSEQK